MKISISGIFSVPRFHFDLASPFINLLKDEVKENILQKYPLPKVKSEELEIYICTDGTDEPSAIRKISKTDRGNYLTFHFWISYPKVVNRITEMLFVDMNLDAFVKEFMFCLQEALKNYGISENVFLETENSILEKLNTDIEKYQFVFTESEGQMRLRIREYLDTLKK